jgi:hypothetical protein
MCSGHWGLGSTGRYRYSGVPGMLRRVPGEGKKEGSGGLSGGFLTG